MFDYIFITHLPSFYKINLYNELSKTLKIGVIFVGDKSKIRADDFTSGDYGFEHFFLSNSAFEKRSKIRTIIKLFKILTKVKFKKIVVGGWDLIEFWITVLVTLKNKNCLALESGIENSKHSGLKKYIKYLFLKRISIVFASGESHKILLEKLEYKGNVEITKGVGIINKPANVIASSSNFSGNFIYVGRLSPEKNIQMIIEVFNELQQFNLQIVGTGPLELKLKEISNENIHFLGHVPNEEINKIYLSSDVFILPSKSEPWGLVVEEALFFGLPVIISSKVGCGNELVKNKGTGIIFDEMSKDSFTKAIFKVANHYKDFKNKILEFNINKKDREQINSYLVAIKK